MDPQSAAAGPSISSHRAGAGQAGPPQPESNSTADSAAEEGTNSAVGGGVFAQWRERGCVPGKGEVEETRQREEAGDRRTALKGVRAEESRDAEALLLLRGSWLVHLVLCLVWHGRGGRAMFALCLSVCVCVCVLFVCCLVFGAFIGREGGCTRYEDGDEGLAVMKKRRGWQSTIILESGNRNRKSAWYRGNEMLIIISYSSTF